MTPPLPLHSPGQHLVHTLSTSGLDPPSSFPDTLSTAAFIFHDFFNVEYISYRLDNKHQSHHPPDEERERRPFLRGARAAPSPLSILLPLPKSEPRSRPCMGFHISTCILESDSGVPQDKPSWVF